MAGASAMDYRKLSREELLKLLDEDPVDVARRLAAKAELVRRSRIDGRRARSRRWGLAAVVLSLLCFLAALAVVPEFRRLVRLDTPTAPPQAAEPLVRPPAEPQIQPPAHSPQPSLRVELRLMIGGYELMVANEGQALAQQINVDVMAWQQSAPGIEFVKSYPIRDLIPGADTTVYSVFEPPEAQGPIIPGAWHNDLFSREKHYHISGYFVVTCNTCSGPRAWAFYVPPQGVSDSEAERLWDELYLHHTGQRHPWPLAEFRYPKDRPNIGQCVDVPRGVCRTNAHSAWVPNPAPKRPNP